MGAPGFKPGGLVDGEQAMCDAGDDRIVNYNTAVKFADDRVVFRFRDGSSILGGGAILIGLFVGTSLAIETNRRGEPTSAIIVALVMLAICVPGAVGLWRSTAKRRRQPHLTITDGDHIPLDCSPECTIATKDIDRLIIHGPRKNDSSHRLYIKVKQNEYPVFLHQRTSPKGS